MSALQKLVYRHMQSKGILLTDGSERDKKVAWLAASSLVDELTLANSSLHGSGKKMLANEM